MKKIIEFRLLDTGLKSSAWNMAANEVLTSRAGKGLSPPSMRFLRFEESALLGFHQVAERELRLDYCRENNIQINRRLTGGGALLFQDSALGWEFIAPMGSGPFQGGFEQSLERICRAAAEGYRLLGLDASFRPRNDIEVKGRKISGTGGFSLDGGMLFQGTVLIKNEIERFLRALRVPVEKLRKREIDSLMQRLAFVEDLLGSAFEVADLKKAMVAAFEQHLGMKLIPAELSPEEEEAIQARVDYYSCDEWVFLRKGKAAGASWLRQILQTDDGTLIANLWLDSSGRLVQKALVTGDFFSIPQRLIFDLEASLMGSRAEPEALAAKVKGFLDDYPGRLVGISSDQVAQLLRDVAGRKVLAGDFTREEAAELFFVNYPPAELGGIKADWLLLPYCSKPVDCDLRKIPRCDQCGLCQFDQMIELAGDLGLRPVSIQSFEHLMIILRQIEKRGGVFVGSCCEAFYCKHQKEMEECGARGVLINLDSTTCYDLGKGMEAYVGNFDHQTFMNTDLIEKVSRIMTNGR